jgi:hypothetical protein
MRKTNMNKIRTLTLILIAFLLSPCIGLSEETISTKEGLSSKVETRYWITSTNKRHNSSCRYFGTTKTGRYTTNREEGIACKICGG